ncbi:MAG: sulfotransferase domain-containing protein [Desulfovibrionaceae bacterium]|jgi:hypothetical protein|nr:sulfotransferase domain-containing protein [Desulfovibrionaceae bacterium]
MRAVSGSSDYPAAMMGDLDELVQDAHEIAHEIARAIADRGTPENGGGAPAAPANVYVYGALGPAWLVGRALDEHPRLAVRGYIDRDRDRLLEMAALGRHVPAPLLHPDELPPGPTDGSPNGSPSGPTPADAVVVATAPAHHRDVAATLARRLPRARIFFLHRSPCAAPARAPRPPLLLTTPGRCGTLWLAHLLGHLLRPLGYRSVRLPPSGAPDDPDALAAALVPGRWCAGHVPPSPALVAAATAERSTATLRAVHLFRDPRDMQVSAAFYNHGAFRYDPHYLELKLGQIEAWKDVPGVLHLRYEKLRADTAGTLARVLAHAGIDGADAAPQRVRAVCRLFTFERLSGGRSPGQEDGAAHYRKGVCGDWKNRYSAAEARNAAERFGARLATLGYEP